MVVHGINKQNEPQGDRYVNPLGGEQIKGSSKKNTTQTQKGGCGVQEGEQDTTSSNQGLPACSEYELTLAWMWDTQDVRCPPHER